MTIYILSRGQKEDQDYSWFKIKTESLIRETPPIFKRVPVETVIDHQKPSMILARQNSEFVLLVTGLKAREERADFMGRSVRNSIAWVDYNSEEAEKKLRSLAILALKNELELEIDRAINIGAEYGFQVNKNAIEQLASPENLESQPAETVCKLGKNCPKLRQELAEELQKSSIPSRDGFLIIITTLKAKSALSLSGVWRGLSDRIENEEWEIIPHSNQLLASPTSSSALSKEKKTTTQAALTIAIILAIILIYMAI
ncbi:hypothetical protein [Limnoraphis robusta]|uniref:Uncharacterized protein n=1 Tax=Limnoraphis robusta CCNP1315 TaxID=3110306 RepID=A0ABU5U6J6_9CYAN|nr:hypothetical protein [Limnoraphis robusta]MEA5522781.1 hypothetical protein [Limnoraphis robusta CCNP1315]MEA5543757.1 hypothetical protein [Limnoraphis robusta CCNP1324]